MHPCAQSCCLLFEGGWGCIVSVPLIAQHAAPECCWYRTGKAAALMAEHRLAGLSGVLPCI